MQGVNPKLNTGIVNHGSSSRVQGPAEEVSVEKTNETLFSKCIKVAVGAALIVAGEGIPLLINIGLEVANQRLGGKGWGESFCVGVPKRAFNAPYDVGNFVCNSTVDIAGGILNLLRLQ